MSAAKQSDGIVLSLEDVRVAFGGVVALNGVSLELTGPGIVGIVGPNGSGKSTSLGVLSGLVRPSRGVIRLNGADMTGKSALAFARRGIGRSFQAVRLVPTLTIRDNLLIGMGRLNVEDWARVRELVDAFQLEPYLAKWPSEIPAGVQRLVQVAAVVLTRPSVVLLDEPAAGLTDAECSELEKIIRQCATTALTVVVEHNMQLMYSLADRVVALVNGQIAVDGPVSTVWDDPTFRTAYLGVAAADETGAAV